VLLDLRLLLEAAASTGAPVVVGGGRSGDEMYAFHLKRNAVMVADEEAALALYLDGSIDLADMLNIVERLN
jgi:hypothetical protein